MFVFILAWKEMKHQQGYFWVVHQWYFSQTSVELKYLNNYYCTHFHKILCRHSWFPEDETYWLWWSSDFFSSTIISIFMDWHTIVYINCTSRRWNPLTPALTTCCWQFELSLQPSVSLPWNLVPFRMDCEHHEFLICPSIGQMKTAAKLITYQSQLHLEVCANYQMLPR